MKETVAVGQAFDHDIRALHFNHLGCGTTAQLFVRREFARRRTVNE